MTTSSQHFVKFVTNYGDLFIWKRACRIYIKWRFVTFSFAAFTQNVDLCVHPILTVLIAQALRFECRVPTHTRTPHSRTHTQHMSATNQEKWPIKVVLCWRWRWRAYATNNYWQIVTKSIVGRWVAGWVLTPNVQVTHFYNEKTKTKNNSLDCHNSIESER